MSAILEQSRDEDRRPDILVADDEPGMREGMRRILASRGFIVTVAADGVEALKLAEQREYPLVLADLRMPGVDGFELIKRLRILRPSTLCIVVSAFATVESAVQTTKLGAFDVVVKPFEPEDLLRVVNRASEQWRLTREAERLRQEREGHLLELTAEKTRLRAIVQSMGDGLLVVNVDGLVVLDNPAAHRLLERVNASFSGIPVREVIPDEPFNAEICANLAGETDSSGATLELHLPGVGGTETGRYLRTTLSPVRDETGRVIAVVVLLADITEAKAYERMRSLFVSMVAHEVKAPIAAVQGYLNIIRTGTYYKDAEQVKQVMGRCLERTGALLALVNDLLEITRRESGRQERRLQPVSLAEVANNLIQFHQQEASQRSISIALEAEEGLPSLPFDPTDADRLLTNLLSNAIKYNREGGKVTVSLSRHGTALQLEVRDTGIGMSAEECRRLGEEFFRAKNPKTRAISGTGLGVALVKKIIDAYNGTLEVESASDQGTTFRVFLPLSSD